MILSIKQEAFPTWGTSMSVFQRKLSEGPFEELGWKEAPEDVHSFPRACEAGDKQ